METSALTSEQYNYNVEEFKRLLRSTKRKGIETVIQSLEREGFFDAHCYSHDRFKGGTLNHCLWVTKFGLETFNELLKESPFDFALRDYSVILVCLLHDVCDSEGFKSVPTRARNGKRLHGFRSMRILYGFKKPDFPNQCMFSSIELNAVSRHMHYKAIHLGPVSTRRAKDIKTQLHYILKNSDGRAVEYYKNIPYGTKPRGPIDCKADSKSFSIPLNADGKVVVSVNKKDNGNYSISGLGEVADAVFYITRFPDYRDSYVMVKSVEDGLWRSVRIKTDDASYESVSGIGYPTYEESRDNMRNGRFLIRVRHTGCFEEIPVGNIL